MLNLSEEEKKASQRACKKKYRQSPEGRALIRAYNKKYYQIPENNAHIKARSNKNSKKLYYKIRDEIFTLLGQECVECSFSDQRALQFDHKNGGGVKERRSMNISAYYKNILKNPSKFQILCANHNWIKRYENNELDKTEPKPHTSEPADPSTFRKIDKKKVRSEVIKIIRENKKLEEENTPKGEEISVVVTQVENNPPKTTYFTVDGTTVPRDQVTKSGDRFFRTVN